MMEADLLKFEPEFMEKVVPLVIVKYESNIQELKQYKVIQYYYLYFLIFLSSFFFAELSTIL